ncbi:unnamed protein product [Owenia fusiformis]|uniref:Uncharacterized protein n=1 Tax=Owenia fusiformis TaxID=6347 RepID=A0A8J1UVK6_OWEFU|nr:unnamed protein product [Owenia fusiformis]
MAAKILLSLAAFAVLYLAHLCHYTDAQGARSCSVPDHFWGDWYTMENGEDIDHIINSEGISNKLFTGKCIDIRNDNQTIDADGKFDSKILFYDQSSNCYKCYELYYRTPNIVENKMSTCDSRTDAKLEDVCRDILPQNAMLTMFRKSLLTVNCKTMFEGVFQFTYEVDIGGGGICDSSTSKIVACQEPGSPYVDNEVFLMKFGYCPDVSTSSTDQIRFQCMGSWRDNYGNVFAAALNTGQEIIRERFRCFLTRDDQQRTDNKRRYTMSNTPECSTLKSPYDGPLRLVLNPVVPMDQMVTPHCNLPRNYTGKWFTVGEYDTQVYINSTHIYYKTKIDAFTYIETYFTCQQTRDSRFLTTAVTVGKCEVDFICFDFLPRHHNIIRFRMGKPFRITKDEMDQPNFMVRKFRQACTWSSFTFDRDNVEWKYRTYILDPPSPIVCPIAGRYQFTQHGPKEEHFTTRIRGITDRPRHRIDCRETESVFEVCSKDIKTIFVDSEYCSTVDYTGRPVGEYDEPDRELRCVGYWMEDMKSYLITYDEEDAITRYRCWVYQRLDWRNLIISRATRAQCGDLQTAESFSPSEGASLHLKLYENERLFDECPQYFNDGSDPWEKTETVWVLGAAGNIQANIITTISLALSLVIVHLNLS